MRRPSRRELIKGAGALAASVPAARVLAARAACERDHAGVDRRGEKRRQGCLLHLGRACAGREDREIVRGKISGDFRQGRAHRRRTCVPAHRPGICEPHFCGRCGQLFGRRTFCRLEARGPAGAVPARGRRQALSCRPQGSRRTVRELSRDVEFHRLQHRIGEGF